uniref:NR LBD domain-containing protein n=1 Tax=Caenorhabditis tropicalis TaxID=1561998 RepID=A0A1I7V3M6_9PELO
MVLMREQVRAQIPNSLQPTGEDVLLIFSRPETLPCADCEGLKPRFNQLLRMLYEITKDHEGFIQLMCKPEAGLYLLKGTAVLNHFFSKEQQKDIQGNRVTNCPIY